jgi:hypothetical protein
MPTLSLAMIVKDEQATIRGVLGDVAGFCDELVVVDTGSSDDTVRTAEQAGARVAHYPWHDDFAAARNFAFDQCGSDWILWLDADDRIPPDVQPLFATAKDTLLTDAIDAVLVPYRLFGPKTPQCLMTYERERLIRRVAGLRWSGAVHEAIAVPTGRFAHAPGLRVEHRPQDDGEVSDRNIRILERVMSEGDRSPRTLFYYANELRDHGRHADAVAIYREYLTVSELPWEAYDAQIRLSQCLQALGDTAGFLEHAAAAVTVDSSRAEAYMLLGLEHYAAGRWAQAVPLFLAATAATRPVWGFSDDSYYGHLPWDYLGVCYHNVGMQREALEATLRALPNSPDQERLRANLRFITEAM